MFLGSSAMNRFSKISPASLHLAKVLNVTLFWNTIKFFSNQINAAPSPKTKPLGVADTFMCGLYNGVNVVYLVYLLSFRLWTLLLGPGSAKTAQIALIGKWLELVCSGAEMLLYPVSPKVAHGHYSRNGRKGKAQKQTKPFPRTVRTAMLQLGVKSLSLSAHRHWLL